MEIAFFTHVVATIWLTGLVWFVQVVHYPLYKLVNPRDWIPFETEHVRRTKWVTFYPMLLEALSGFGVLFYAFNMGYENAFQNTMWVNAGLSILVWVSTFTIQYPTHMKLCKGYDIQLIEKLIVTNWFRVVVWSIRTFMVIYLWILLK